MPKASDASKPAIVFNDVTKHFKIKHAHSFKEAFISAVIKRKEISSQFRAVDGFSLEVPEGQSVALMGRNGSGKSTTLKLLSGVMEPDSGWIRTRGRIAGLLEVGAGFHPDLTGRENVYLNAAILGMSKEETDAVFDDILAFSEIGEFIDTEVKRYSSGMYSRLGFAVAVHVKHDVLLVDEVLSVGDAQFRAKCEKKMLELQEQGNTMFIVSHSAGQVKKLCQRGVVLEHGKIIFDGPIEEAVDVLNPPPSKPALPFNIDGAIRELYDENPRRFGNPLEEQIAVQENGGGVSQRFEKGIITSFENASGETVTLGLTKGILLTSYTKRNGPHGDWGFIAGNPHGNIDNLETRTIQFSNGLVTYTIDDGLEFHPGLYDDSSFRLS